MNKRTKAEESEIIYNAFSLLMKTGQRLAIAESFTGGLIASALISIPGASAFMHEAVVAYSDAAKINRLGVPKETIQKHTAVSADVAYDMAHAMLHDGNADVVLATTGYAGPSAPHRALIGECYIAVGDRSHIHIYRHKLSGGRENIMRCGMLAAFEALTNLLKAKTVG
jgi:PncC family amidohydrolase